MRLQGRILVIDDSKTFRHFCMVQGATNAVATLGEAAEELRKGNYDTVLLDVHLTETECDFNYVDIIKNTWNVTVILCSDQPTEQNNAVNKWDLIWPDMKGKQ